MKRMHEGILYQDQYKRYCLYEPGVPAHKRLTCTSGCRLEVWLNRAWIAGYVEGDGEDYWLFADSGGRFLLAQHMKARYREHHWRSWHQRHFQYLRLTFHTHYHFGETLAATIIRELPGCQALERSRWPPTRVVLPSAPASIPLLH